MPSPVLRQGLPKGVERLRDHPNARQHRHEVGVPGPAGNNMPVEMVGQPRARRPPQVQSYIESVRLQNLLQEQDHPRDGLGQGKLLLRAELFQPSEVPSRATSRWPLL